MAKKLSLSNIYIFLWLAGFVQELFVTSSLVSLLFSVPSLLITFYCFVKVFATERPHGSIMALGILFVVLLCYGFGLFFLEDAVRDGVKIKSNSFLLMVLNSLGPVFAFYYFSRQNLIDEEKLTKWFFVFLASAIVNYYYKEQQALALVMDRTGKTVEEVTNNAAYTVLSLFPFLFLFQKKPVLQYLLLGVVSFFVVSGLKRGAMLTLSFLIVWFVNVSMRFSSRRRKWIIIIFTVVLIVVGWKFLVEFYANSDYFQTRVERTLEGSSSGRDEIYSTLWNHYINNDNIFQLAFGEGAYHTFNIAGNDAHNDWLELLIDCGLFTVIIYIIYWICFFHDWMHSKSNALLYSIMGACFIDTFLRSLFSMSFSDMTFYMSIALGWCFAQSRQEQGTTTTSTVKSINC